MTFSQKIEFSNEKFKTPCNGKAADLIHEDGIHILINMNGYTKGARNEIFALRPAPIQVMWLGYPSTSGAPFMDYMITDAVTSPMDLAYAYSEKLAYMPHTFFIGDHAQMLKHLTERVIVKEKNDRNVLEKETVTVVNSVNLEPLLAKAEVKEKNDRNVLEKETVTVVNSVNLEPLLAKAEVKKMVREAEVTHGPERDVIKTEVVLPVIEVPTTEPLKQMIGSGLVRADMEGVQVQNGLTTLSQKMVREAEVTHGPERDVIKTEVVLPVIEVPTTEPLKQMIGSGLVRADMEGVQVQNGLTTLSQTHLKGATGEEVPHAILITSRQQYGLPDDAIVFCNFNQLYKIDPPTLSMWCDILKLLYALGVPELVAKDREDYVRIAVKLGTDRE
ncbi:unnamed protein product [Gongylonema pulchrum]|uniref:Glyco_transf_41 domain-containing protein n=1 Tax=Gongylonema pulchrum TaxID=637853 RepID=A0A183EFB4_9BILA|nr:unnamed protein product [Gongylonema pulchrum]